VLKPFAGGDAAFAISAISNKTVENSGGIAGASLFFRSPNLDGSGIPSNRDLDG
jgi:hypothetical protein